MRGDGMDRMGLVIIGLRPSKSIFGANKNKLRLLFVKSPEIKSKLL